MGYSAPYISPPVLERQWECILCHSYLQEEPKEKDSKNYSKSSSPTSM